MLGVGRFGGIAGSFLVAELSRQQMGLSGIFTVVAMAGAASCIALLLKQVASLAARRKSRTGSRSRIDGVIVRTFIACGSVRPSASVERVREAVSGDW